MVSLELTDDRIKIANLFNYYVYDMSEFTGWSPGGSGLFVDDPEQITIHEYWQNEYYFPYVIKVDDELAGFALVRMLNEKDCFDIGQFFVLRKFKGKGIGREAIEYLFRTHPGKWQVRVLVQNTGAKVFWDRVLPESSKTHIGFDEEDEMKFYEFSV